MTWDEALDAYVERMKTMGIRQTTRKGYVCHVRTLAAMVPAGPSAVTPTVLAGWLATRGPSKRASWSAARSFFGWAARAGVVAASPVAELAPRRYARVAPAVPEAWQEPLRAYVSALEAAGRGVRTIEVYLTYLRRFAASHQDPWLVTYDDLVSWLAMSGANWKPATKSSALKTLRGFYREGVRRGWMTESPVEALMKIKEPRGFPRPAPAAAVHGALDVASDRDALLVLFGVFAGLRAAEIAAVRPSTDIQEGWLYVTGKGQHQRRVPVHPVLQAAIEAELDRRRGGGHGTGYRGTHVSVDGWMFPSPLGGHLTPGAVSNILSHLLPPGVTAHMLRHRFASEAYAACLDLRAIQELLGHASPATTARYTAVPSSHLLAAVRGIGVPAGPA